MNYCKILITSISILFVRQLGFGQEIDKNKLFHSYDSSFYINDLQLNEKTPIDSIILKLGKPTRIKNYKGYNIKTKITHLWQDNYYDKSGVKITYYLNDSTLSSIRFYFNKGSQEKKPKKLFKDTLWINSKPFTSKDNLADFKNKLPEFRFWGIFQSLVWMSPNDKGKYYLNFSSSKSLVLVEWNI